MEASIAQLAIRDARWAWLPLFLVEQITMPPQDPDIRTDSPPIDLAKIVSAAIDRIKEINEDDPLLGDGILIERVSAAIKVALNIVAQRASPGSDYAGRLMESFVKPTKSING